MNPASNKSTHKKRPRRLAWPRTSPFHGGNTGSNPVGDANKMNHLLETPGFSRGQIRGHIKDCVALTDESLGNTKTFRQIFWLHFFKPVPCLTLTTALIFSSWPLHNEAFRSDCRRFCATQNQA